MQKYLLCSEAFRIFSNVKVSEIFSTWRFDHYPFGLFSPQKNVVSFKAFSSLAIVDLRLKLSIDTCNLISRYLNWYNYVIFQKLWSFYNFDLVISWFFFKLWIVFRSCYFHVTCIRVTLLSATSVYTFYNVKCRHGWGKNCFLSLLFLVILHTSKFKIHTEYSQFNLFNLKVYVIS